MILIAAILSAIVSIFLLMLSPVNGMLFTIMVKSLIDATWENYFFGVTLLQIIGITVPLLMLAHILRSHRFSPLKNPLIRVGLILFLWNTMVSIGMAIDNDNVINAVNYFFRNFNFFMAMFLFPFIVRDAISFKKLLIFMLLAGIFPMLMGMYQFASGTIWEVRHTAYGLERNVGLYHDAFSFRGYGFQVLTAIILMLSYFTPRKFILKVFLIAYAIICCIVIFNVYSKAAIVIAISWIFIWSLFNKNKSGALLAPMIGLIFYYFSGDVITQDVLQVFVKEIGAYQGTIDEKYILSGRTTIWEIVWQQWLDSDLISKFIGSWINFPAHNDLLRVLYTNGIIGLILYVVFIAYAGLMLYKKLLKQRNSLTVMGIMVYVMWLVDVTGLPPSLYPAYSWYVWGFISLALIGVPGLDKQPARMVSNTGGKNDLSLRIA